MAKSKNALIVLCAGQGRRMGRPIPKLLLPLAGRPILYWTLKNAERCSAVHAVVLAVPPEYRKRIERSLARWALRKVAAVVDGGAERTDSTRNALAVVPKDCGWVGVHDGARPFAGPDLIRACFKEAHRTGGAIVAVPSKDTVKEVHDNGVIERTIPRACCWAAQTPQVFRKDIALKIHNPKLLKKYGAARFTDDASLAEALGLKVRIVPGSYENIKITTPEDMHTAESILRRMKWR